MFKKTALLVAGMAALGGVGPAHAGEYLPGDFHQHSLYTDGSYPFQTMMDQNARFDLGWWANSEHGGRRNRDGEGVLWLDTNKYPTNPILGDNPEAGYMYRWQGLRDYVYPDILAARERYPSRVLINGVEWNPPGHEHCTTAVYSYDGSADAISEFEYRFDKSDPDTSRTGEPSLVSTPALGTTLSKTNLTKEDSILGVQFMQALVEQGVADAWVVPAHIERAKRYAVEDFRNWNNAGPDVAFGFEGAPGHQASGERGFSRGAAGGGTYGGSGWFSAEVGGLWDALLGEGRNWWNFASSDSHSHWAVGGGDFWPGEYQKNYTYIDTDHPDRLQAVFDGVRSGNSWHVMGDLIDALEFTAHGQGKTKATMGQTLAVQAGKMVTLKIKVRDPNTPNQCPLDLDNPSLAQVGIRQPLHQPVLDHIDLISGEWGNKLDPMDPAYTHPSNPTAAVVARFERRGGADKNGYLTYVYHYKADKNRYFRLRGTNLPAGVPLETDADGNPLADSLASDNLYAPMNPADLEERLFEGVSVETNSQLDEVAEAYADLWFYSNPIFVKVGEYAGDRCDEKYEGERCDERRDQAEEEDEEEDDSGRGHGEKPREHQPRVRGR